MPSFKAFLVRFVISWIRRSKATLASADKTLSAVRSLYLRPDSFSPPNNLGNDISIDRVDLNQWPLYRVSATTPGDTSKPGNRKSPAMLYLHGGAWFREITPYHWQFTAQVARETGLDVLVPIYPLIPHPTATSIQIVDGLMEICRQSSQTVVCIAGDSAGGHLCLTTAQRLQTSHPDVAARLRSLVMISPALDLSFSHPETVEMEKNDPWLAVDGIKAVIPHLADGLPLDDARISPLHGQMEGLPPAMLLCGTSDMLCADARRLSAKYQNKVIDRGLPGSFKNEKLTYIEHPDMIHVYPILPHPEGAEARGLIMDFVKSHLV